MADRSVVVRLRAEVAGFKAAMDDAAKSTRKVGEGAEDAAKKADTSLGRMVKSAQDNRQAWDTAGATLTAFGATALAGLGVATNAAMSWESAWTGVLKTVDGTPEQLAAIEAGLRGMARELPASHEQIAAVAEAAGQLGVSTDGIVSFTRTMIDLGETTNIEAEEAAMALAKFSAVVGTAEADIPRLGSTIVGLGNNFATTEADIVGMATRLSAAGAVAGFTEPQILGLATAMSSIGIEAEAGGTAMSQTIQLISKSVIDGGEKLDGFAKIAGMSADQFTDAWNNDPIVALDGVISGLARMNANGDNTYQILENLGISGARQVAMLQGLATATGLATDAVSLANTEWEANNALILEATKRYETTESKIAIAKNALNDAAITIGGTFLPILADAAEGVADLATWIGNLPEPVLTAGGAIAGIAGTAGLAAGAFLLIVPRVLDTVTAFKQLQASGSKVPGMMAGVGKAAGIAGAALGIVYLTDALKNLTDGAGRAIPGVQDLTRSILDLDAASTTAMFSTTKNVDDVTEALDALTGNGGITRKLDLFASKLDGVFGTSIVSSVSDSRAAFEQYDSALANLVSSGHADRAAEGLELLYAQVDHTKYSMDDLRGVLPGYAEALAAADNQQKLAAGSGGELAGALESAAGAATVTEESLEELVRRISDYTDTVLAGRDATRDMEAAYDAATAAIQENGTTLDITTEKGRANEEALDAIAQAGLKVIDTTRRNGGSQAELQAIMQTTRDRFIEVAQKMGASSAEAEALADKLGLIPSEVRTQVTVDTSSAEVGIERFISRNNGRRIVLNVDTRTGNVMNVARTGAPVPQAEGGLWRFANGGGIDQNGATVPREPMLVPGGRNILWAEPETHWEAYISGKPSARNRNISILEQVADRFGYGLTRFDQGGYAGAYSAAAAAGARGARLSVQIGQVNTRDSADAVAERITTRLRDALVVAGVDVREVS